MARRPPRIPKTPPTAWRWSIPQGRFAVVYRPWSNTVADGRRIKQTVGPQVTNYLWDEDSAYGDVVLETDGSGSMLASYVLGDMGLISQSRNGATSYYLQDGQGSTRALTNAAGNVTDTYSYTAFGELLNQTGSTTNSYLYTGQQFDSLTGLYDLRARYYNPALGRFLSQDTYPVNLSNPVELNRYVYVANSPINAIDPTGHMLMENFGLGGLNFGKVVAVATVIFGIATVLIAVSALVPHVEPKIWEPQIDVPSLPRVKSWEDITNMRPIWTATPTSTPKPGPNPTPEPTGTLPPPIPTLTKTPEPGKPIVLDLGPGMNISGEILPLIAYYKPQGIKVVAIEQEVENLAGLKALESSMPNDFSVISGSFTDSSILSSNGYGCAQAAFSLWPGYDYGGYQGFAGVPTAINNLVCSGGYVHVISEVPSRFDYIANVSTGFVDWQFRSPVSQLCVKNPVSPGCSGYSAFSIPVGFNSEHNAKQNYALIGRKK